MFGFALEISNVGNHAVIFANGFVEKYTGPFTRAKFGFAYVRKKIYNILKLDYTVQNLKKKNYLISL